MKTYEEAVEWFREHNLLNKMCRNVGHHDEEVIPTTLKIEFEKNRKELIMMAFYWGFDRTENWSAIYDQYVSWFIS